MNYKPLPWTTRTAAAFCGVGAKKLIDLADSALVFPGELCGRFVWSKANMRSVCSLLGKCELLGQLEAICEKDIGLFSDSAVERFAKAAASADLSISSADVVAVDRKTDQQTK